MGRWEGGWEHVQPAQLPFRGVVWDTCQAVPVSSHRGNKQGSLFHWREKKFWSTNLTVIMWLHLLVEEDIWGVIFQNTTFTFTLFSYFGLVVCSHNCSSVMSHSMPTPWTIACQAPLSMEFSRQEYWIVFPIPSPVDLPYPGIKAGLLLCRQIPYQLSYQERPVTHMYTYVCVFSHFSHIQIFVTLT